MRAWVLFSATLALGACEVHEPRPRPPDASAVFEPLNTGTITLISYSTTTGSGTIANASFLAQSSDDCTTTAIGDCEASTCVVNANTLDDGGARPLAQFSAGLVTISGGVAPIVLTPSTQPQTYDSFTSPQPWFRGGELITIDVAGDMTPRFVFTPNAPSAATITPPPENLFALSRAADFTISWTGGTIGAFGITIESSQSGEPGTAYSTIRCFYPILVGHGTVPAAALAFLPVGTATISVDISERQIEYVGNWTGSWTTTGRVVTYAQSPDGNVYTGGPAIVQ